MKENIFSTKNTNQRKHQQWTYITGVTDKQCQRSFNKSQKISMKKDVFSKKKWQRPKIKRKVNCKNLEEQC